VVKVGLDGLGALGCKVGQDEAEVMSGLLGLREWPEEAPLTISPAAQHQSDS
jgi:hypothetical protein